jgi:hypothetical protein
VFDFVRATALPTLDIVRRLDVFVFFSAEGGFFWVFGAMLSAAMTVAVCLQESGWLEDQVLQRRKRVVPCPEEELECSKDKFQRSKNSVVGFRLKEHRIFFTKSIHFNQRKLFSSMADVIGTQWPGFEVPSFRAVLDGHRTALHRELLGQKNLLDHMLASL